MEKINILELLKDCPKGMELDCTVYNDVTFLRIDEVQNRCYFNAGPADTFWTTCEGRINGSPFGKCVIFPKGKTTWEGFVPPCRFTDGDIVITTLGNIAIIRKHVVEESFCIYGLMVDNNFYKNEVTKVCVKRLATEEEKKKLFDAIKAKGYKWNAETKTLEKLPKFKVGDRINKKGDYISGIITAIDIDNFYKVEYGSGSVSFVNIESQDNWELVPNKFDITTLKPFDKVLVRNNKGTEWTGGILSHANYEDRFPFKFTDCAYKYCIPYNDDTKHLVGTTDDCDEFFKTWK